MKTYLLAVLLLAASPVFAQATLPTSAQEAGNIDALDAKNGFRTYRFGTPMANIPGLQKRGKDTYAVPKEPLNIGDAKLFAILFSGQNGKLSRIVFAANGEDNSRKLLDALRAQYGEGHQLSDTRIVWDGSIVLMTYELREDYPTYAPRYGTPKTYKSCIVSLSSKASMLEEKAEKEAAAKKAGSDL